MKKISFILIGTFLTVLLSSHFLVFKISEAAHRDQFRSYISKHLNGLKKIEINPSQLYTDSKELKWKDNNNEIVTGNMIYDVIAVINTGKTVSLYIMNDEDEKKLSDNYAGLADHIFNESGPEKPNVIKDFLSLKFFSNQPAQITIAFSDFENPSLHQRGLLSAGFHSTEVPPPAFSA
ncbi:MAG: hypothetical protein ACXVPN_05310 [Bacteroidia bacterium]